MPLDAGILDSRIPLAAGASTPKIHTPAENQQIVADAENARTIADANRLKLEEAKRAQADQQAMQRVMQEAGGDWEVALPRLRTVAPGAAAALEEQLAKTRKERALALKGDLETEALQTQRGLALLRAIPEGDAEMYAALKDRIIQMAPDLQGILPEQYDPAVLRQVQSAGETAKDAIARNQKALELLAEGKWHTAAGTALSAARDQEDWDEAITGLREMGVPRQVLQQFGAWAPDAPKRAEMLAMTPDTRADNAARDVKQAADIAHQQATEAIARGQLGVAQGNLQVARGNLSIRQKEAADEPLVAVTGPDGKPVLVRRSQAEGKAPASGGSAGGGGRGVTSADANRMADFDSALDDLATLNAALTETAGATGAGAALGAALPNMVTEFTGVGGKAKQRQAVIERVKQVIGKTLEGGVLRKEDEYKYTKILPTISDPDLLAKSKLQGLEKAIRQRRQTQIEALSDAGYDTSAYEQRTRTRTGPETTNGGGGAGPSLKATPGDFSAYLNRKKGSR